jgi:hypothetical protein
VDVTLNNAAEQIFRFGVIARAVRIGYDPATGGSRQVEVLSWSSRN